MPLKPFALTMLSSRGGMSTAAAFFLADSVVICDVGALGVILPPRPAPGADVAAWCEATRAKSKRVVVVPDAEIHRVCLNLRMRANELSIACDVGHVAPAGYRRVLRAAPVVHQFTLLDREQTEPASSLFAERFGMRFELATTRVYAFVHRIAPLLTR